MLPDGTETQVAYIGADPSGNSQHAALGTLIQDVASRQPEPWLVPLRVDHLPTRLSYEQATALPAGRAAGQSLRAMIAAGGDELDALYADLASIPAFAIAGPPMSGRSSALLVMAESLLAGGTKLIVLTPRESPVQKLDGRTGVIVFAGRPPDQRMLKDLLDSADGTVAVLVDDAEVLHAAPAAELLSQIPVEGRARGHALVIAGATDELLRTQRAFTAVARQYRRGLLLTPQAAMLGQELFGTRLPRSAAFDGPPGRGYLIRTGQAILAQVPEPPAS